MPARVLGFDIDSYAMKIAVCDRHRNLIDFIVVELPDNMIRDGHYTSPDAMGDFIRETMKEHHISGGEAAVSLSDRSYFLKRVKLPRMTTDQLAINLPFEFHDYISGETTDYVYDYAVLGMDDKEMELMAATTSREMVNTYTRIMKRAGLHLVKLVPGVLGLQNILLPEQNRRDDEKKRRQAARAAAKEKGLRARQKSTAAAPGTEGGAQPQGEEAPVTVQPPESGIPAAADAEEEKTGYQDYAVLDLTHDASQFHFFSNGAFEITRDMNTGLKDVISTIAKNHGVEAHIADLMMQHDQDQVLEEPDVDNLLDAMTTEIMRTINFYNYNNSKNNIDRILYCGGGLPWEKLLPRIREAVDLPLEPVAGRIPGSDQLELVNLSPQSVGVIFE